MNRRNFISAGLAAGLLASAGAGRAAARSGQGEMMALGWYVIFSPPSMMEQMTAFYGQSFGLPMLSTVRGSQQNKNYFWAGEDIVIDLSHHAPETPLDTRKAYPATARQVPLFRTDDLDAVPAVLRARGANILPAVRAPHERS